MTANPIDLGLEQLHLARLLDTMHRENVLGQIDANCNNGHDFPFRMSS